ncbi:MAG: hypothetical protein WKF84_07230 [Pyrinomonadaceae bacterium]
MKESRGIIKSQSQVDDLERYLDPSGSNGAENNPSFQGFPGEVEAEGEMAPSRLFTPQPASASVWSSS